MIDLQKLQIIADPLSLNLALMGCLILVTILLLYIVTLRRKLAELRVACATDEKLRNVLKSTDELLGKLDDKEIESFVSSPEFEVYKEVVRPIIEEKKKDERPTILAKTEPPKQAAKEQPPALQSVPIASKPVEPAPKKPVKKEAKPQKKKRR